MWRLTFDWDMRNLKGKKLGHSQADRLGWLNENLARFDGVMFKPGMGAEIEDPPGEMPGFYINSWAPIVPPVWNSAEPKPWLDHFAKIVPDEADREVMINYMAFLLQNPGLKVNWAPVLIGREGSGKDTLFHPLTKHLGRYAREALTLQMVTSQFNGWIDRCLFALVQEKQGGRWHDKHEAAEALKTLISAPPNRIKFERKGMDAGELENVVNLVFFVNSADALQIDRESRRYFPIESDFLPADPDGYFVGLWGYLNDGGAEQVVAWLLRRRVTHVRERMRAPKASAFERIVEAGLGPTGEAIANFVEGRDWVSIPEVCDALYHLDYITPGARAPKAVAGVLRGLGLSATHRVQFSCGGKSMARAVHVRDGVDVDLHAVREALKEAAK
ncbi:primase-helicase family protein [Sulfitobacter sp. TBRI5]|uniref:primase-helicase family protein n=1 Tax=Sulfitobacter sp. TBRI5 TaxID=2989732 RepID=UPI003D9B7439